MSGSSQRFVKSLSCGAISFESRSGFFGVNRALLQGVAGGRGVSAADVVALQFAVKGGATDTEHATRERLIAFHLLEDTLDGSAFDVFEIGGGERDMGRSRLGFGLEGWHRLEGFVRRRFGS